MVKLNVNINPKEIKYFFIKALTLHLNKRTNYPFKVKTFNILKYKYNEFC